MMTFVRPYTQNNSSPPHSTNDIPSTVLQVRTRSFTHTIRHCLENHKTGIIFDLGGTVVMKVNAHFAKHQRMIDKFQEHV